MSEKLNGIPISFNTKLLLNSLADINRENGALPISLMTLANKTNMHAHEVIEELEFLSAIGAVTFLDSDNRYSLFTDVDAPQRRSDCIIVLKIELTDLNPKLLRGL